MSIAYLKCIGIFAPDTFDELDAKLFKGLYETGTSYTSGNVTVTTGFDHIKELGVNAVQLIPIYDQANDERPDNDPSRTDGSKRAFNWGYNPLNYNSLDGIYSTNPYDGYAKIIEFKDVSFKYDKSAKRNILYKINEERIH